MAGRVHSCDLVRQVTLRSSVMGFPLRAILSFNLYYIQIFLQFSIDLAHSDAFWALNLQLSGFYFREQRPQWYSTS